MLRLIILRIKEYFYIPFEWLYMINALIWVFYLTFFWKIVSTITKVLSFEQFIRFSFYYYLITGFLMSLWGFRKIVEDVKEGKFTVYLLYPKDPLIFFLLKHLLIPFEDTLSAFIFLSILKFKVSAIEILLVIYSSAFLYLLLLFLSLLSAISEINISQSFSWSLSEIGIYPTFVFDERFRKIFYYIIPIVFAGTFPLLLNTFKEQFISLLYFSLILSPILFTANFFLMKSFLKRYQAYGA